MNKTYIHISRLVILSLLFSSLALLGSTGEASSTVPEGLEISNGSSDVRSPTVPGATDGPDEYGYTWDDSVASSWIEISTTGTDTGLSGFTYNKATGSIPLGFSFDFYENRYDAVYIAGAGYISFSEHEVWPWSFDIPNEYAPNNIIAPYATPLRLASSGPAQRIYYQSGGYEPNRYFVVEWYQVPHIAGSGPLTFQVILHENGDIVFNYPLLTGGYYAAAAGIEDSLGLDGLWYLHYGSVPIINVPSIHFYRPADLARVKIIPPKTSQFSRADMLVEFPLTIHNTGELGEDTYDLSSVSTWPVSFFDIDGLTPLTDTDGDEVVDTGSIPQASNRTVIAKMQTPSAVSIGDADCGVVTATSSLNTGKSDTAELCATIPAPFAGVFMDTSDGAVNLDLVKKTGQDLVKITAEDTQGEGSAIVETGSGYAIAWSQPSDNGSREIRELYYLLTDSTGTPLGAAQKLIDLSGSLYDTYDEMPAIDVAPDGSIGIIWKHSQANELGQYLVNLYFAVIDQAGNLVYGPTNITSNTLYGNIGDPDYRVFNNPVVKATPDDHFVCAWDQTTYVDVTTWYSRVYLSVLSMTGSVIKTPTKISNLHSVKPAVGLYLPETGYIIVAYSRYYNSLQIVYSIYDTSGEVVNEAYLEVPIDSSPEADGVRPDIVTLSTGQVLVAFDKGDAIGYSIIGSPGCDVHTMGNPDALKSQAVVSVTADQEGHGIFIVSYFDTQPNFDIPILTTTINPGRRLYYALIDADCSVITPLRPFYTSINTGSILTNGVGYSATSLSGFRINLPLVIK